MPIKIGRKAAVRFALDSNLGKLRSHRGERLEFTRWVMRVAVQFEEVVRPLLIAWRRSLSATPHDRRNLADIFLDELKQRLVKSGGLPQGTVKDELTNPPTYWCELSGQY